MAKNISKTSMNSVPLTGRRRCPRPWSGEALLGGLEPFIGQGADRDTMPNCRAEDVGRHDADLALTRRHHARQFGPDQPRLRSDSERFTRTMSSTGMPSVMQTISGISASIASQIASAHPAAARR